METYSETDIDIHKVRQNIQVADQTWKYIYKLVM